ncbi:YHS domain-containing protein [Microbacterium sp. ZKA21]|uniref:YHS domain-containing protein n=1 Tax=Microbacterium sp. ZKA21 TaxID=3381694 RepID=UPI003D1F0CA9
MSETSAGSCCSVGGNATVDAAGRKDLLAPSATDVAVCVVMGGSIAKSDAEAAGLYRDHEGERYYFCCAGCAPKFDADPGKYVTAA